MCTVSYLPGQSGFILTSSRDEKITRPIARLSDPVIIHDQEVTFPKDPLGHGTWIASSNTRTVCLLNGAFKAHQPKPPYKHSRGLVVLDAFDYFSLQSFAGNYNFKGLEPFTLLLIEVGELVVLRWDGSQLFVTEKDASRKHIWSSATLYKPEIIKKRQKWFDHWISSADELSLDSVRKFHLTAGDGDPENAIRMRRDNLYETVSLTSVVRSGTEMYMIYEDLIHSEKTHKPCRKAMYPINQVETEVEIPVDSVPEKSATFNPSKSARLIRLKSWEYWPFSVVYIPVFVYWLWLSLKARSFFFFSASNPSIESGGMLGESKIDILDLIDDDYKPVTVFVKRSLCEAVLSSRFFNANLNFPVIAKPNAGERGWGVEKIGNMVALYAYHRESPVDYLIQEYVDYPLEFGVFYYRMPNQRHGTISSIVQKEFLSVTGNGCDNLAELILANDRAVLQWDLLKIKYANSLHQVLIKGKKMTLVTIGNHCLGTKFLNANHLITPELTAVFDKISVGIHGFYYGRYDLRCTGLEDFYQGKNIKIMELNGAGAEPAHIYDPCFSIWEGWKVLLQHWAVLYKISSQNHKTGVPYMGFSEARSILKRIKADKKQTL